MFPCARSIVSDRTGARTAGSSGERVMASISNSRTAPLRYSASAKAMHWFVAAAVITLLLEGPVMKRLVPEGSIKENLYLFHEALGALVLIVMIARLARRLGFGVPAPDATMPVVEQRASLWAQYALYSLLFLVPVLGWAGTNAYGDPVSVFGLFEFPAVLGKDQALSDRIFVWHLAGGILIAAIVVLHVAGALYHGFVKRDGVLKRMLPGV
jgi:cytochrome b561